MTIEEGNIQGEICGRNGCAGIIDEHKKEGSCSCHNNPPCTYCTTDTAFCPVCDWQASDEQHKGYGNASAKDIAYYKSENEKWAVARESFYSKYNTGKDITKLEIRHESHTHFSQKQLGVFPKGTETRESILPKVNGTFGGRFTRFNDYSFEFIAYTD